MLNPFRPDQSIGDPLDILSLSLHGNEFQAVMFIEMNVHTGDDGIVMKVLEASEKVQQFPFFVGIDDGDSSNGLTIRSFPFFHYQGIADKIPDRLASVRVPLFSNEIIKSF